MEKIAEPFVCENVFYTQASLSVKARAKRNKLRLFGPIV